MTAESFPTISVPTIPHLSTISTGFNPYEAGNIVFGRYQLRRGTVEQVTTPFSVRMNGEFPRIETLISAELHFRLGPIETHNVVRLYNSPSVNLPVLRLYDSYTVDGQIRYISIDPSDYSGFLPTQIAYIVPEKLPSSGQVGAIVLLTKGG